MDGKEVILRSREQSLGYLNGALDGLTQKEAAWSPGPECNSIAFILWHLTRVLDFFIVRVLQRETELYEAEGWREKLGTPEKGSGFEYTVEQLKVWPVPKLEDLRKYADAVQERMRAYVDSLTAEKMDEVPRPERSSDSIGATLTRITTEMALHVGQIAYLRGVQRGLNK